MIKLVYSNELRRRSPYVVFYDRPNRSKCITTRSFADIDDAIEFAWRLSDLWLGNVDRVFKDRLKKVNHPMLTRKCWDFA
jgi:hypothetical protein